MDRMTREELEAQASLDRALELDAQENEAWATAMLPLVASMWADLEWDPPSEGPAL